MSKRMVVCVLSAALVWGCGGEKPADEGGGEAGGQTLAFDKLGVTLSAPEGWTVTDLGGGLPPIKIHTARNMGTTLEIGRSTVAQAAAYCTQNEGEPRRADAGDQQVVDCTLDGLRVVTVVTGGEGGVVSCQVMGPPDEADLPAGIAVCKSLKGSGAPPAAGAAAAGDESEDTPATRPGELAAAGKAAAGELKEAGAALDGAAAAAGIDTTDLKAAGAELAANLKAEGGEMKAAAEAVAADVEAKLGEAGSAVVGLLEGAKPAGPLASDGDCGRNFRAAGGGEVTCTCGPAGGPNGTVYGSHPFTADSSICAAARFLGLVGAEGGSVTAKASAGCARYAKGSANGITTNGWGAYGASFVFPAKGEVTCPAASPGDACPSTFAGAKAPTVTCACPANAVGALYGAHPFTTDSSICAAARFLGLIGAEGGQVTAQAAPGCSSYAGGSANGVTATKWGAYGSSFVFPARGAAPCPGTEAAVPGADAAAAEAEGSAALADARAKVEAMRARVAGEGAEAQPVAAAEVATPKVGDKIRVEWKGQWYPASVVEVKADGSQWKIHYDGWGDEWDEWVGASRTRTN